MYSGNAIFAIFQTVTVSRVRIAEIVDAKYGQALSVSGKLNDFTTVGIAASASARILKIIAMFPDFVIYQSTRPTIDKLHRSSQILSGSILLFYSQKTQ
jgi:hypothetical protein